MRATLSAVCAIAILAVSSAGATPLPTPEPAGDLSPEELAASRKRYMRILVLPGAVVGGGVIVATVLLSNRARRRSFADGASDDARR